MRNKVVMALAAIVFSINLVPADSAPKPGSSSALGVKARSVRLGDARQFKTAFQNDRGKVRLVALVSPT
jgi:hypothetical protein